MKKKQKTRLSCLADRYSFHTCHTIHVNLHFSVPSRAPANVRVANHGLNELLVEWDPLPPQYANGIILGYSIFYKDTQYYYSLEKTVNTSKPEDSHVILAGIQIDIRYRISVAAFTSKGQGPRSPYLYVTKGRCSFECL